MRIGIVDPVHAIVSARLRGAGHEVVALHSLSAGERAVEMDQCQGLVVRSSVVDAERIDRSPGLRFIGRVGAGLENIDVVHCHRKGIRVLNSPEGNRDGVGETCVLLLLALMKLLIPANASVRAGLWPREALRGTDLRGKTVGIIGFGQMGSAFAEKLRGFGVRVLGHDKYRHGFSRAGIEECGLEQVMRESDVISLHLPLNAETAHYVDDAFLHGMKRPIWFINTARGGVVHTRALLDALDDGRVIAAGLDVLEFERPTLEGLDPSIEPDTQARLLAHERVILTPHIAGVTHEGKLRMAEVLANKILHHFPHATS
ncbi:MAG TPA: NAD(P)-dependent oxidoreductase [Flavobacteriales bacterium]|nr:NAD(P)-dependent oxidoreductase [Flavobacteriales bacterium]